METRNEYKGIPAIFFKKKNNKKQDTISHNAVVPVPLTMVMVSTDLSPFQAAT